MTHRIRLTATTLALALFMATGVTSHAEQNAPRSTTSRTTSKPTPQTTINLNVATAAELEALPGVGPSMASRIVDYRQKNGAFKKIEDLMNVKGIGEKKFLKLKPLVTVASAPAKTADRE